MLRVVLDTNIIISAALSKNSTPDRALSYAVDNTVLLISKDTFNELQEKLLGVKFDKYVQRQARETFLTTLLSISEMVIIKKHIVACRDSKDDKFLELAVNGNADYIVTGDKDLLVLHPFDAVEILTAADFLKKWLS
jgi:putative PIN family toxin of toxin-antitoxin system